MGTDIQTFIRGSHSEDGDALDATPATNKEDIRAAVLAQMAQELGEADEQRRRRRRSYHSPAQEELTDGVPMWKLEKIKYW